MSSQPHKTLFPFQDHKAKVCLPLGNNINIAELTLSYIDNLTRIQLLEKQRQGENFLCENCNFTPLDKTRDDRTCFARH